MLAHHFLPHVKAMISTIAPFNSARLKSKAVDKHVNLSAGVSCKSSDANSTIYIRI